MRTLKINRLLRIYRLELIFQAKLNLKFETEIPKQTWVTLPKPRHPETEKSNIATGQPFIKWGHWKSIGSSHIPFGVDFQSQTKVSPETKKSNMATRRPFWKWRHWKTIGSYPYIQVLCHLSLASIFNAKLKLESGKQKIKYGCLAAILLLTLLKINRLLHIYISIVLLKFGVDIQSQTKVRVWKPKNPIWPPGGHFESDVAENQ